MIKCVLNMRPGRNEVMMGLGGWVGKDTITDREDEIRDEMTGVYRAGDHSLGG